MSAEAAVAVDQTAPENTETEATAAPATEATEATAAPATEATAAPTKKLRRKPKPRVDPVQVLMAELGITEEEARQKLGRKDTQKRTTLRGVRIDPAAYDVLVERAGSKETAALGVALDELLLAAAQ